MTTWKAFGLALTLTLATVVWAAQMGGTPPLF